MQLQFLEATRMSLKNELYCNAAFLCERVFAECKNEEVRLLLAECYLGNTLLFASSNTFLHSSCRRR